LLASACCGALWTAGPALAANLSEFVDPNPAPGNLFGATIVVLNAGNVVITSPYDDAGGADAGAVYVFHGGTGALISTLRGSTDGDRIGTGGVVALSNGNYVVCSPYWNNGGAADAGAATWGSGTTGVAGVVSAANSLVGSTAGDYVGLSGALALSNGNYVVRSPYWTNGGAAYAGAATWGNGTTGVAGVVSPANSLVGSTASDYIGNSVTALTNGNYVVHGPSWDNGASVEAGSATWGDGTTGVTGVVTAANSLVGTATDDNVGFTVSALANGNYVVSSSNWNNGAVSAAGAVTWGNGTTGVTGAVSVANSLVGTSNADHVGSYGVVALSNGNFVVLSPDWSNGAVLDVGAATWGNGTTGLVGAVSASNSLIGSTAGDLVSANGVTTLSNGNYVVRSAAWDNGAMADAGASTWGDGTTGVTGTISTANSLVGSAAGDLVGVSVVALSNGNYVVCSPYWHNGALANAGAVTWGSGTAGVTGTISAVNSLVGASSADGVGSNGVTALSNGNYLVLSPSWQNSRGAATWGNGTTGVAGTISVGNSLVGSTSTDNVGVGATALPNGNYVVRSPNWDNGGINDAGAATWGDGGSGVTGSVSAANSLVGSASSDGVGGSVAALPNGNYVVVSPYWNSGAINDAGAATWGGGTSGVTGAVSTLNSLVGSSANDYLGNLGVTTFASGDYVVASSAWNNGALVDAGAATLGSGTAGVTGTVNQLNSRFGMASSTQLFEVVVNEVHGSYICAFLLEDGGRVRVGPLSPEPGIVSAIDIPNDQGGWLRLTFNGSALDHASGAPPVSTYGVWRHIPGTLASSADGARGPDDENAEPLRAAAPAGLDTREEGGRILVTGRARRGAEESAQFPPGTWEQVANVAALQQGQYVVAVPTITNAAPNDYLVTAHTTTPSIWFVSAPASGQSVDNLAPAMPAGLTAGYSGGQTNLQWAPNTENDIGSYRVYRGTSESFVPGAGNQVGSVTSPGFGHVGPAGGFYKVSARDVNGNESGFALITPAQTTGVEDTGPIAFALEGAWPNPASGARLDIAFALPAGGAARLELMDVSGRRVLAREVGSLGPGRHTVSLAAGRPVAPGLYWVRLTHGASQRQARVAVVE